MRDKRRKKLEIEMPENESTGNAFKYEFRTDPRVVVEPTAAPKPVQPPVIIMDSETT